MQNERRPVCNVIAAIVQSSPTERVIAWHLPTRYEADARAAAQTLEAREGKLVAVVYETNLSVTGAAARAWA